MTKTPLSLLGLGTMGTAFAGIMADVALLSAMYGMLAGASHAYALVRGEEIPLAGFARLLTGRLAAMLPSGTAPRTSPV